MGEEEAGVPHLDAARHMRITGRLITEHGYVEMDAGTMKRHWPPICYNIDSGPRKGWEGVPGAPATTTTDIPRPFKPVDLDGMLARALDKLKGPVKLEHLPMWHLKEGP